MSFARREPASPDPFDLTHTPRGGCVHPYAIAIEGPGWRSSNPDSNPEKEFASIGSPRRSLEQLTGLSMTQNRGRGYACSGRHGSSECPFHETRVDIDQGSAWKPNQSQPCSRAEKLWSVVLAQPLPLSTSTALQQHTPTLPGSTGPAMFAQGKRRRRQFTWLSPCATGQSVRSIGISVPSAW